MDDPVLDAAGAAESEPDHKAQVGLLALVRTSSVLVSQVLGPLAFGLYLREQQTTLEAAAALATAFLALGLGWWARTALYSAAIPARVLSAGCALLGTGVCLGLYSSQSLHNVGVATGLCALALVGANLAPSLGLLWPHPKASIDGPVTPRRLPTLAFVAGAEIAIITTTYLHAGPQGWWHADVLFFGALLGAALPLLLAIVRARTEEGDTAFSESITQFLIVMVFVTLLAYLAGLSVTYAPLVSRGPAAPTMTAILLTACGIAVLTPVVLCWRQAVEDQRFPAPKRQHPAFDHINSWAVLLFGLAVAIIFVIALWAATSQANTDGINANWGLGTTALVGLMFVAFAFAPHIELPRGLTEGLSATSRSLSWVGRAFSWLDGVLAVPVACAAGANLDRLWTRYVILTLAIVPCGVLGYWLPAPFGLLAIIWGFLVTIAISRRWAWVEDDRELAMLTRNFSGSSLRVGFKQDLRDEALLSFMSMFIFVPLALRQFDMWAADHGTTLFVLTDGAHNNLRKWVAFYGSELAKAVPFVDWAETYSVEGKTNVEFKNSIWAKHLVFLTRILVDLVFLGALLQAMAISARISKQREMFFGKDRAAARFRHGNREKLKGELDRLDPFIEAREFRKLIGRDGLLDRKMIEAFPTYDVARLIAVERGPDKTLARVARALHDHQRSEDPQRLLELHEALYKAVSASGRIDKERVVDLINALKAEPVGHDLVVLRAARGALNGKPWSNGVRRDIMNLIVSARESEAQEDRLEALVWCLTGDLSGEPAENPEERVRDSRGDVREIALTALMTMSNPRARAAIEACAQSDPAEHLKRRARSFLDKNPAAS